MSDTETLRALMEADRWIERVRSQRDHLPESVELAELERQLRELLAELKGAEAVLAPLAALSDQTSKESERLRLRARDLDHALGASTASARELTAIQGELTHVRERLSDSEDRELAVLEELEPAQARVEEIKGLAQPGVRRRSELMETIKELRASLEDEVASLTTDRVDRAREVAPALLARYDAALARVGTSGASQVIEGRCDGCRLRLSPLDYDHFKVLAADTFMDCPECGRILLP
ncbi:MAG TPA: C4-type zinc ribbon domain-containing protein [Acidimicrobiales bacterium]|nr:C4-type zinc ribbon domain-containing protein [Acidimicrobiales bacterium]